jgi:hypothetical protein
MANGIPFHPTPPQGVVGAAAAEPAGRAVAAEVTRGVRRALAALGHASLTEFVLKTGRRADILAMDGQGGIAIVEVKSSVADFRSDRKWPDYTAFCDRFYFAVPEGFPLPLIPPPWGLIVADGYDAAVLREPPEHRLAAARRKALHLRFALAAAGRLHRLEDPLLP